MNGTRTRLKTINWPVDGGLFRVYGLSFFFFLPVVMSCYR